MQCNVCTWDICRHLAMDLNVNVVLVLDYCIHWYQQVLYICSKEWLQRMSDSRFSLCDVLVFVCCVISRGFTVMQSRDAIQISR